MAPTRSNDNDSSRDDHNARHAANVARNRAANEAGAKAVAEQQAAGRTESISQKIARGGGFNRGGMVGNYAYGGATPTNHPGEPMGTDKVPAWLTEGEFVIDKDSTKGKLSASDKQELMKTIEDSDTLRPVVEWINEWEPTNGAAGMEAIRSDEINELAMREKLLSGGGVAYRQLGGAISPFDQQRQAALKAMQARQQGSLLAGGAEDSGIAAANQAGLITQAGGGLGRSFTPQAGSLAATGRGVQGAREAAAQYQDRLGSIASAESNQARADAQRLDDRQYKEQETERELAKLGFLLKSGKITQAEYDAQRANLLGTGGKSSDASDADLANDFKRSARKTVESLKLLPDAANYISAKNAIVRNAFGELNKAEQAAYLAAVGAGRGQDAEVLLGKKTEVKLYDLKQSDRAGSRAFATLQANIQAMTAGALDTLGPGPKTDFDFKVAAQSIADLDGEPWEIKATLENFLHNVNQELLALNQEPISAPNVALPESNSTDTNGLDSDSSGNNTALTYPKDSPLVVPDNVANLTIGAYTAALAWF